MSDRVRITLPLVECVDGASFTANADFEDRYSETPMAPATVDFRVDCLTTGQMVQDWTSADADTSVSIALASTYSAILDSNNEFEIKQVTIAGDRGDPAQCIGQGTWMVRNTHYGT